MSTPHTSRFLHRCARHALLVLGFALLLTPIARAQITFVGAGAQTVSASAGTISPAIPANTAASDLAVLVVVGRPSNTSEPTAPAGWTLRTSVLEKVSSTDLKIMTFYRVLAGGDANPALTLPAGWVGSSAGMSGQIAVWRGIDTTTPFDVADTTGSSNPSATFTAPAITTATAGALVVSAVATSDTNDLGLSAAAGFTARMSSTSYQTTTGGDHAVGVADIVKAAAGAVSMPTWQQTANSPDRWALITFALRPFVSSAKFTINHGGFGINCVAQTITVNVVDSVAGTPLLNYASQVQLDTQSGYGTWALVTGTGTFSDGTANDGVATYTWPLGQSSATFTLYYPQGPASIDVDVFQVGNTGIRDTDAEGPLVFSPSGFTVTAAALSNPPPGAITTFATNETAGTDFSLYLTAYGQTPTDATCGVIEAYTGTKSVKFWSTYGNPATGTRSVTINTVGAATSEGASAAQNVTFTNGQAVVTAKYKDVGRISIGVKDDTTSNPAPPAGVRGATANFVVKPYDFVFSGIQNAAGTVTNPQAANSSGAVFIAAGAPFRATVTVRDFEGSTTPNYGRETPAQSARLVPSLLAPVGGATPAVASTAGFAAFTNGVATGTDFTWSEVGIITVRGGVGGADYLGAGDVLGPTSSERIGRFIPSRFVAALNSPLFNTGCAAGNFTYQGQAFTYSAAPVITATAVSVGGATTTNYAGSFFKLTNSTLTGRSYMSAAGTLDTTGVPATTTDPAVASPSGGVATLTFASGSGLNFTKTLIAPFNAGIQLAINILDSDGVAAVGGVPLGNPVTFGASSGISFTATDQIRYGRIRMGTAIGSELVNLPVPMRAEYYASSAAGFVTNAADTCSTGTSLVFSSYTHGLNAGETCASDTGAPGSSNVGCAAAAPIAEQFREPPTPAAGGDFNLRLKAPGAGNQGSVVITATVP